MINKIMAECEKENSNKNLEKEKHYNSNQTTYKYEGYSITVKFNESGKTLEELLENYILSL